MKIYELNHVNLTTHRLDEMVRFYSDILQLKPGKRPPFTFNGVWLYLDDTAILHLVETDIELRNQEPKINHFALSGSGLSEYLSLLKGADISYRVSITPGLELKQVVAADPDGNLVEVLFAKSEEYQISK